MAARAAACLAYVPVPGVAALAALVAPRERFVRYHAWQGGTLVVLAYAWVFVWGVAASATAGTLQSAFGMVAGVGLLAALASAIWGLVGAARGRFTRVRPVWDLLASLDK